MRKEENEPGKRPHLPLPMGGNATALPGALSGQGYLSHALPWVPGPHPAARICLGTQDPSNLGLLQLLDPRRNEDNAVSLLPSLIWITDRWIFKLREYSTFAWLNSGFAWAQQSARVQRSELEGQPGGWVSSWENTHLLGCRVAWGREEDKAL